MSDFKAMMCIFGVALAFICAVLYAFLFMIERNGVPAFPPPVPQL